MAAEAEVVEVVEGQEEAVMRIGRRCYVGNLAWRTSWQDLKDEFRACGTVVYANVMQDRTGRSKGWGIVEFETPEEAVKAVQDMNGKEIAGRKVLVREDREDRDLKDQGGNGDGGRPRGRGRGRGGRGGGRMHNDGGGGSGLQVVVHGLPWRYTEKDLKDMFSEIGEVESADVMIDDQGRSKGFGTVRFTTPEHAASAIQQFHGVQVEERLMTVKYDKFASD
eukprot:TRINITY_DN103824_c0_g1_i1.p1 TRINITY_DN103824_c0_g1~~TRINITY_DN103824_c0_g1_i1.p1  ORF type:complete len:222 (-),score=55.45 TRINITY_DN103824_c0_g1_i1:779-1444(-)